jgi:CheY-like chemotaxis protein
MPKNSLKQLLNWAVLLVDDDFDSLKVLQIILHHHGATVKTARNGQEALEQLQETLPDFIITDLSMPFMDGWQLLETLQLDSSMRSIPVIALTADTAARDREAALQAGFQAYLTKPFNPSTFLDDLVKALQSIPNLAAKLT